MANSRFVLRYQGGGAKPDTDVERIRILDGASIIDESSPGLLLVDVQDEGKLREVVASMAHWVLVPEQTFAVPDTRKRVEQPPSRRLAPRNRHE